MYDPQELVGRQIDHYRIESHIARGGMADVYLATDTNLERQVAFKLMLSSFSQDPDLAGRFEREARIAASLNHPNIIQVYSTGHTAAKQPYMAMQYIDGGSLHDQLKKLAARSQRLETEDALRLARQIASALETAHQAGIVHRDLKPSNILLRPDGTPVVSDLGIAAMRSAATRLTRTGLVLGTPNYMAPEQGAGREVDGRADIYALGVILYEMLAGKVPFAADSPLAVIHQHMVAAPPPLHEIRPDLAPSALTIVARCLQKEPDDRYQTAADLTAALDRAIAGKPLPDAGLFAKPPAAKRRPIWLYGLAAVFLLLVGWGGYNLWANNSSSNPTPTAVSMPIANVTNTAVPSPTLAPTTTALAAPTAVPSDTPAPTTTPTSAPTFTPLVLPTATPLPLPTPAFTAPYGRIVFTCYIDEVDDICAINADGRFETRLTNNPTTDFYASLSPDGREIAFSSRRGGSFLAYRMNTDGGDLRQLGPTNIGAIYAPAISPDGQRVALAVDESGQQSIWVSNLDGRNPIKLSTAWASLDPVWSPDGRQLAFASGLDGGMAHFIINADGTGLRKLETNVADISGRCDWSPDGRWLAFYAGPRNDRDIYLAAIDGTAVYKLTDGGGNLAPSFSPDGHWITFTSYRDGDAEIFIMRLDGSDVTQLTFNGRPDWQPNWGP